MRLPDFKKILIRSALQVGWLLANWLVFLYLLRYPFVDFIQGVAVYPSIHEVWAIFHSKFTALSWLPKQLFTAALASVIALTSALFFLKISLYFLMRENFVEITRKAFGRGLRTSATEFFTNKVLLLSTALTAAPLIVENFLSSPRSITLSIAVIAILIIQFIAVILFLSAYTKKYINGIDKKTLHYPNIQTIIIYFLIIFLAPLLMIIGEQIGKPNEITTLKLPFYLFSFIHSFIYPFVLGIAILYQPLFSDLRLAFQLRKLLHFFKLLSLYLLLLAWRVILFLTPFIVISAFFIFIFPQLKQTAIITQQALPRALYALAYAADFAVKYGAIALMPTTLWFLLFFNHFWATAQNQLGDQNKT